MPLQSFTNAKSRLSPVLDDDQRQRLAKKCAERVLQYAGLERTFVVCDDHDVANWASQVGAQVIQVGVVGLNAALQDALICVLDAMSPSEIVIVHGDLALPESLANLDDFVPLEADSVNRVFIIPDRHEDGTNVLGIGAALFAKWRFAFGPGSFQAHGDQAQSMSATFKIINNADLGIDIDTPEDLLDERVRAIVISHLGDWNSYEQ